MQLRSSVSNAHSLARHASRKQVAVLCKGLSNNSSNARRTVSVVRPTETETSVPPQSPSLVAKCAAGFALVAAIYVAWCKTTGRSLLGKKEVLYQDVMKKMNTVEMEMLSDDQILAARARRSKERGNHRISLEDIDLPENHPWATRAKVTKEDEEAIRARIHMRKGVRPRPPSQDPSRQTIKISKSDLDAHRSQR